MEYFQGTDYTENNAVQNIQRFVNITFEYAERLRRDKTWQIKIITRVSL